MSEQQPLPANAEAGSVNAASEPVTDVTSEPVMAESPTIAPDQELTSPKPDAGEPKKMPEIAAAPAVEAGAEDQAETPRRPSNVMLMSPGERMWGGGAAQSSEVAPRRRVTAMAAVVALAAVAGAIGGALATGSFSHGNSGATTAVGNAGLEAAIARIDADILALKASVEQNARLGVTQFNKTSDRLDKVEKAQVEPAAKLAKLADEVGKLRTAQAAAPVAAASAQLAVASPAQTTVPKDVTGSVTPPAVAAASPQAPGAAAKAEVARLPTVEGWILREVGRGSALIESRRGLFEVFAGDPIPGLGRVDAIRKQDGRWVVVTSKGLIVSR